MSSLILFTPSGRQNHICLTVNKTMDDLKIFIFFNLISSTALSQSDGDKSESDSQSKDGAPFTPRRRFPACPNAP